MEYFEVMIKRAGSNNRAGFFAIYKIGWFLMAYLLLIYKNSYGELNRAIYREQTGVISIKELSEQNLIR